MTTPTNDARAMDVRLHELLTGEKCEWRYCAYDECDTLVEQESVYAQTGDNHQLARLIAAKGTQPCYKDDRYEGWWPVPEYHNSIAAVRAAELALAPELREDYARELVNEIVDREDLRGIAPYPARDEHEKALAYRGIYALITATAAQRAQALVAVLERVRGEVGT